MEINLKITPETIEEDFARIANELMNQWVLAVNDTYYRITEIEFYCKSILDEGPIKDPYTHGHAEQKKSGTWYFHGSGIDLTFGCEEYYGGILIRGIYKFDSTLEEKFKHISGPLKSVTEILSSFGSCELKDIEFGLTESVKVTTIELTKKTPIKAPRVGLNLNTNEGTHDKLYRFLIAPKFTSTNKSIIIDSLEKQGIERKDAEKLVYK